MEVVNHPESNRLNIEKQRGVKGLNQEPYTISIINAGLRERRIGKDEAEHFQLEIMDILKDLILRYTNGESTSVKVDTAENLLNSIIYSMDAGFQSLEDTESAIKAIKSGTAKRVYDQGLIVVTDHFERCKTLYRNLRKNRLKVGLEAYDLTIDEGLTLFIEKYGPVFDAHQTMASIDYPLLFDDMSRKGVFYFENYLETLCMEDRFCKIFPEEEIKTVLMAHGRIHRIDYSKTLTNIFELVLNSAFFATLSEETPITLPMSQSKYRVLTGKISGVSPVELDEMIETGLKTLLSDLHIEEKPLFDYILKYKETLKTRMLFALETDNLKKMVLLEDESSLEMPKTIFIDGERMGNDRFKQLVRRLTKEQDAKVKLETIRSEVHSLEDLFDLLEGSCFFGDEYYRLYSQLSDLELALIAKEIFSDEMRDGPFDLFKAISGEIATRVEWQVQFVKFFSDFQIGRIKSIEKYINYK